MGNQVFDERLPLTYTLEIITDTTPNRSNFIGSNVAGPFRLDALTAVSFVASPITWQLEVYPRAADNSSWKSLGSFIVPAHAGDGTVPVFDVLAAILPATVSGLVFSAFEAISISQVTTDETGLSTYFRAMGGEL